MTPLRSAVAAVALLLLPLLGAGVADPPAATPDGGNSSDERWYALALGGQPCGHMHVVFEQTGDELRTVTRSVLRLGRGAVDVAVESASEFVETPRGEPLRAMVRLKTGPTPTETSFRFGTGGDKGSVEILRNGKASREELPKGDWLTPQAVERFVTERMKAGAKEISYSSLDLESGPRVSTISMKRVGEERTVVKVDGVEREIPVSVWESRNSLLPVVARERYSSEGELVESVMPLGIGELRSRLSSKAEATKPNRGGAAEVLVKSFVEAKRPIRGARESTRLNLRVRALDGELPELPSVGAQRATRVAPDEYRVEIVADRGSRPAEGEASDAKLIESSALIDGDSPAVAELVERALKNDDALRGAEKAETLRRFVNRHLRDKNLESAFASASEAAKSRSGDCSEHAVLLAAMLRKAGIRARVASGLVYADQFAGHSDVWGWHVWTQALVPTNGDPAVLEWMDFDATLPTRFDAAHLCTGVGDLSGGATDPMWLGSLQLLGNLSIETVEANEPAVPAR